jgi:hypothetical protein
MCKENCFDEMGASISSYESVEKDTLELYQRVELNGILPLNFLEVANNLDQIVHAHFDSIVVSLLCLLPPLCSGATVSQTKGGNGRSIILYMLLLAPSGVGKSSVAMVGRKYVLNWLDNEYKKREKNEDIKILPDVFLDAATAEGLEASFVSESSPHCLIDEFGKFANAAKNDVIKASFLRMLMQIFDSGMVVSRKLKDTKRSKLFHVKGMGLFAASTIGPSNLAASDMRNMISDGLLNRFLVVFGRYKRIPLRQELNIEETVNIENFARKFHEFSKEKAFYLGLDSFEVYKKYHAQINESYYRKYITEDDSAGMDIRLLTISQRIAMLFQVCMNVMNDEANRLEISGDAMDRAVRLLDYLDKNHFNQILLYANSKNGRPTLESRVKQQLETKGRLRVRDVAKTLNKVKSDDVRTVLSHLVKIGWADHNGAGVYWKK